MRVQKRNASSYCYLGFVLLCAVLSARVESKWEERESLLAYLIDSGVINQEMAELLLDDCTLQLSQIEKTLRNLEEEKSSTSDSFRNAWHIRSNKQNPIFFSIPRVNKILVDCVSLKHREKSPGTWYALYFRHIFGPRLSLARRVLAQTPGQAPAPSPTASSRNPEPSRIPTSPPEDTARPPVPPFFPPNLSDESFPPTRDGTHPSGGASDMNSNGSNKRTVVIAVVVTACVTFLIAGFLFLFCRGCCGLGSRQGKNDERPLLSLSLSDYSISSSHKQYHSDASLNEEKLGSNRQSFKNNMSHSKTSGKFFNESHSLSHSKMEVAAGPTTRPASNLAETTLPASPRIPAPPGLPPLKPPPGRTEPPKPPAPAPPPPPPGGSRPPPPPPLGGPRPPPLPPGGPRPPPPPPLGGPRPPLPPPGGPQPPLPAGLRPPRSHGSSEDEAGTSSKAKLKPFFWDKVLANPDHSMVWHQIKSGSFQFNEEMIESLFGYAPAPAAKNKSEAKKEASSQDVPPQYVQIIDAKKAQNLAILLKALNVTTEEVCDALEEGNELPPELIQNLLKMGPTAEEELKLRVYTGELSLLGPAERFLKVLVNIPFAFKRLESLLYMCTLQEEISMLTESFSVLEAACSELRKSRLFLKLLEAVLKTGNRMNDGTFRGGAQAFKLDTLLKLSDVKGTDGKTTLLHFVVQEIIRSEGLRVARQTRKSPSFKPENPPDDSSRDSDEHLRSLGLEVVSGLGNELKNVRRAAAIDGEGLTGSISKLGHGFVKAREFLNLEMKNVPEENGFLRAMRSFVQNAEVDVRWAQEEEKRIVALVKSTADYFHGNSGKDEGLRLFVIVRDFLLVLDRVCLDVKNVPVRVRRSREEDMAAAQVDGRQKAAAQVDARQRLFPAITDRRVDSSSSDDES